MLTRPVQTYFRWILLKCQLQDIDVQIAEMFRLAMFGHVWPTRQVAVFYFIPAVVFLIFLFSSYDTEVPLRMHGWCWTILDAQIADSLNEFASTHSILQYLTVS